MMPSTKLCLYRNCSNLQRRQTHPTILCGNDHKDEKKKRYKEDITKQIFMSQASHDKQLSQIKLCNQIQKRQIQRSTTNVISGVETDYLLQSLLWNLKSPKLILRKTMPVDCLFFLNRGAFQEDFTAVLISTYECTRLPLR